jgi:hypothetical protein
MWLRQTPPNPVAPEHHGNVVDRHSQHEPTGNEDRPKALPDVPATTEVQVGLADHSIRRTQQMSTQGSEIDRRTGQGAGPRHVTLHRAGASFAPTVRIPLVVVLTLAVVGSMVAGVSVRAQGPEGDAASEPGLCLEAASSVLDPGAWSEILDTVTVAVERNTDFFPDAAVVTLPDLTQPWDPGAFPTVRIGIWGTGGSDPGSTAERLERLAATDCLREGSEWTTTISYELVLGAAESMLAGARLPQDDGELLIAEDIEADIDVEFYPSEQRVRTILDFSKPVLIFDVHGTCWIDDVFAVDAGEVVVTSQADMKGDIGASRGCALFQEFLDETGAGERAIGLLPTEIPLADGSVVRFVVRSVEVDDSALVMAGSVEMR